MLRDRRLDRVVWRGCLREFIVRSSVSRAASAPRSGASVNDDAEQAVFPHEQIDKETDTPKSSGYRCRPGLGASVFVLVIFLKKSVKILSGSGHRRVMPSQRRSPVFAWRRRLSFAARFIDQSGRRRPHDLNWLAPIDLRGLRLVGGRGGSRRQCEHPLAGRAAWARLELSGRLLQVCCRPASRIRILADRLKKRLSRTASAKDSDG
jgi:hypothetical protein